MSRGLCISCKHFIHRTHGKMGGLRGVCERSSTDMYWWEQEQRVRDSHGRNKCLRYEQEIENECDS